MPTRFLDKHRRAKRASRRLHLAFWLGALVSYLCYLIIIVPLFIFMAALFMTPNATGPDAGLNNLMMLVLFGVAIIAVFLPVFKLLKAYNGRKRELGQQSAGEQAEALGGSPARPDDDPLENRYVNLVAELSLAAGIPAPAAYVLRDDDSINAFALSGAGDSLALAVSRGGARQPHARRTASRPRSRIRPHRKRRPRALQPPQRHACRLLRHRQP